ncbi:NAD(P)-dependent oxidoreductase [Sphingorhabdus arenilitoris]|uniref:precorrin-2 dehydrogenase n=1 Tax=Sphingorhabdus arenilitoris TaxID=1490041 RepID=A0ABV8RE36_9SPHN
MDQLPLFVNLRGKNVVLAGTGDAADAKRRLIERAGGICVDDCPNAICRCAKIAFVAIDDDEQAVQAAQRLRAKGMIVNVVDKPDLCDFTTPAIIDRTPVLIAVGTGGASAGMAKAIRQKLEALLPSRLGRLADNIQSARDAIKRRWPGAPERRRALDQAFQPGGALDPFAEQDEAAVATWLDRDDSPAQNGLAQITLLSNDPDDLTLRTARLLGEADYIFYEAGVAPGILQRARADAVRQAGAPPAKLPNGLSLFLTLKI